MAALKLTPPPGAPDRILLGMRAEDLTPAAEPSAGLPFELGVVELLGPHGLLTGTVLGQPMRVVIGSGQLPRDLKAGSVLHLRPDPARLSWMDAEGVKLESGA